MVLEPQTTISRSTESTTTNLSLVRLRSIQIRMLFRNSRLSRACLLLNRDVQVEESFLSHSSQVAMRCMEQLVRFIKDASGVLRQASLTIQRRCLCRTT